MSTKVLVVLDGGFRFDASGTPSGTPQGIRDFTYSTLTSTLSAAGFAVTKAHRGTDSSADIENFQFNAPAAGISLIDFDAIWLIGHRGRNAGDPFAPLDPNNMSTPGGLGPTQLNAIAAYMETGGGIFAVGDHDSIGGDLCGYIPRVRIMRTWYGVNDPATPFPQPLAPELQNNTQLHEGRADTVHKKDSTETPPSQYPSYPDGIEPYTWFQNQSDRFPQQITPTPANPAHPILRRDGNDITRYPDHMHEGNTLGMVNSSVFDYASVLSPFGDMTQLEFRAVAGHTEFPTVIATGQGLAQASRFATAPTNAALIARVAVAKPVNTLSVYDGRNVGVGRIVTGSTFHHYVDINLTGDSDVTGSAQPLAGDDAVKGHGYNDNADAFDDIRAVYVNITNWISRPKPAIALILERSTFSQNEITANPVFAAAIRVTVDGLKPNQLPGGGVTALGSPAGLAGWAPVLSVVGQPIAFDPTSVDSDDPSLPDRVQRLTFTYQVRFTGDPFAGGGGGTSFTVPMSATLTSSASSSVLTDNAWLELTTTANPFMLDLADGNDTAWLSSDIRVFHVVAGSNFHGVTLPAGASRSDALTFIRSLAGSISSTTFTALPRTEEDSVLSLLPFAMRFPTFPKVYNFALARVRVNVADADPVRVFFRIFTSQTTAALTYRVNAATMLPVDGYVRTPGAAPIALPGTQNGGADWLSFPMFSADRMSPPSSQTDPDNVQKVMASDGFRIFGALIDNNLGDAYLPPSPASTAAAVGLPSLMMGDHQCMVVEVQFAGTPIPDGATPWTSDKLSQRNMAISIVANPGLDDSRTALHTFEIEATPIPVSASQPPDELMLQFSAAMPAGTRLRIFISTWKADEVVELATRFYSRHELTRVDEHTVELPASGTRYVPLPLSLVRQNGVLSVELPLGIRKGQRFDVSVRQITNKWRHGKAPPSTVTRVSRAEVERLLASQPRTVTAGAKGAFAVGENKVLVTDLAAFDEAGDHALLIEHASPAAVAASRTDSGRWRVPIGAFQLGIPVSTRAAMLPYQLRLLSIMRWRAAQLRPGNRWRATLLHYIDLLGAKVQALGANPWTVPATPDGAIPGEAGGWPDGGAGGGAGAGSDGGLAGAIGTFLGLLRRPGCAILTLIFLLLLVALLWWLLGR